MAREFDPGPVAEPFATLGIERSYTMINAFLYSVYGQAAGERPWE